MRRKALITVGVLVLAWGVLALVLGSASLRLGSGGKSRTQGLGASPACLPSTLAHSAALPGTSVDVSPAPGTASANPAGSISFLGARPSAIAAISVTGTRSGAHAGRLRPFSQGDGAAFTPGRAFDAGEHVEVAAVIGGRRVSFGFTVDTPSATNGIQAFPNPRAAPGDYQSFYTMPGAQPPVMTVTAPDRDPAAGYVFTTNGPGPGQYGPLIYTPAGRLVWFDRLSGGQTAENLGVQTYAGQRALTWWRGRVLSAGFGQGEDIVMNAHYQAVARVAGGNGLRADLHDFQIVARGIAYITAYNPISCDLSQVKGPRRGVIVDTAVQMIDIATGLVRWEWHSLDHIGASESEVQTPSDTTPWDYFHLNSIDAERNGNLLLSARSTWAGYELQAGTGRVLWRLGGNSSSFAMGPGTAMAWQHDGRVLANGEVTFFDDGSSPPIHSQSRGVRIRLDRRTHRASLTAVYTHRDPPLLAASQGNMQTLAGGNSLIGYGGVPAISEYGPSGSLGLDAHLPYDMSFYRALRFPWSARPLDRPAVIASLNNTGEETIVHASWNGATDVVSWRVLAGARQSALAAQVTLADSGFETSATLPRKYAYVSVEALDARGRVLGSSPAVGVSSYASSLPAGASR